LEEDVKEEILSIYKLLNDLCLWLFSVNKGKMTNTEREILGKISNKIEKRIEALRK